MRAHVAPRATADDTATLAWISRQARSVVAPEVAPEADTARCDNQTADY